MDLPVALYIHIPFCAVRCHYCDFNTFAGLEDRFAPYTAALVEEIKRASASRAGTAATGLRPRIRTIFIGGGTPTILPPELLDQIIAACRDAFDVPPEIEITSEANPGTVDRARFTALRALGVNRLSMGVQSFDDGELRWLGRIHSSAEVENAFAAARAAGFANINLDLMFGLPDQDPATWRRSLARAINLAPQHLSLYSLIVEHGTPLADWVRRGQVPEPDDDLAADLYLQAIDTLAAHGYTQYEISNWAATPTGPNGSGDYRCQHNLVYWRNEPYLGLGAGAHSFDGRRRWWNVRPVPAYIQRIQQGQSPEAGGETIDGRLAMGETMMLGLRLVQEGVSDARFAARFGLSLDEAFGREIAFLADRGLLEKLRERVRLTREGRLLGNQVFAEFLPGA